METVKKKKLMVARGWREGEMNSQSPGMFRAVRLPVWPVLGDTCHCMPVKTHGMYNIRSELCDFE